MDTRTGLVGIAIELGVIIVLLMMCVGLLYSSSDQDNIKYDYKEQNVPYAEIASFLAKEQNDGWRPVYFYRYSYFDGDKAVFILKRRSLVQK
jgi:hypothetical protein